MSRSCDRVDWNIELKWKQVQFCEGLGLATEWIEMYSHRCGQGCLCRLGLATEWIEMDLNETEEQSRWSRSCDRVDWNENASGYTEEYYSLGLATEWIEMFHSGLSGVPLPGLGLATEWIEIHPLDYTDISPDCLGLATEWIEILIYPLPVYAYNGLGLATEWIEIMFLKGGLMDAMSRSCDRVDWNNLPIRRDAPEEGSRSCDRVDWNIFSYQKQILNPVSVLRPSGLK